MLTVLTILLKEVGKYRLILAHTTAILKTMDTAITLKMVLTTTNFAVVIIERLTCILTQQMTCLQ